jgi:hypothetical protein
MATDSSSSATMTSRSSSDVINSELQNKIDAEEAARHAEPRHHWLRVTSENNFRHRVLVGNWYERNADISVRKHSHRPSSDVLLCSRFYYQRSILGCNEDITFGANRPLCQLDHLATFFTIDM